MELGRDRSLMVYCIDVGTVLLGKSGQALAKSSLAWAKTGRNQEGNLVEESSRSLISLSNSLLKDLSAGFRVALGVEAPMWLPLETTVPDGTAANRRRLFDKRFDAEKGREWYKQAGASAAVRAPQLVMLALSSSIARELPLELVVETTHFFDPEAVVRKRILVWEAFCVDEFKPNYIRYPQITKDEADALAVARLFLRLLQAQAVPAANGADGPILVVPDPGAKTLSLWSSISQQLDLSSERCCGKSFTVGSPGCA